MRNLAATLLAVLLGVCTSNAQAENFRCGKWIASPGMSVPDLLEKCGEPASREVRTEDVLSRNFNTGLMYKTGEQIVETWTYDRGSTAPPIVVTIVDGVIRSMERKW